ncbi:MAG: molybdopterin molybdotransferase MoeA [Polaribacter sp.]|uniref:molybdopterin molybdotransferase MoeA n=1 Tax=Polaribacter sp. TaxID=1920175 RepID=UPI00261E7AE8|nr:molybdopterin molybdotransferase MoeA [Polaribacter sp.]MDG1193944.1 molybdopterin molybdotransferase MoeA [Polaribacter sp.]MDG1403782.1 molybdopterin molybdotransferase MoeA [Polaribacter sp.]MDG2436692.1 molybdopterin molybdotransferase MoeA [Polaribacter sp.]
MISVAQALQTVLNSTQGFGVEEVPFLKSVGKVLKEDIVADRDFPPFNRVSMDGIAINHRFFEHGIIDFNVEGIQAAGAEQKTMTIDSNCMEVMTGAVLPINTDTVIRYEDVQIKNGIASINLNILELGKNIHSKGKDRIQGDLLIEKNTIISAAEIGVIATVGKATVKVAKTPKVIIVSTGDELVEVNENPLAHQIRRSNAFTLVSLLKKLGIKAKTSHIADDKEVLQQKIANYLKKYDVLIFSGAVSKGKFDFLPAVLAELKVEKLFHRITQRPGKPFWYGVKNNKPVFAFPGNPISTFVNCLAYFYPWYYKSVGIKVKEEMAILGEDVSFKPSLTYFLQVKLENKFGHLVAFPITGNGSGDLASLIKTDAFIQLPNDRVEFKKGEVFPILKYR